MFLLPSVMVLASAQAAAPLQERADRFLDVVNATYKALVYVASEAQWNAATDVTPAHDAAAEVAGKAMAAFTGNPALIDEAKALLKSRPNSKPITVRQLERVLLNAAEGPMTNPELVGDRIAAETQQASTLNGFVFKLDGKPITANEIDDTCSTQPGPQGAAGGLGGVEGVRRRPQAGPREAARLRNGVAEELGYPDYFALQVAKLRHDHRRDGRAAGRVHEGSCGRSTCSSTPGRSTSWRRGTGSRCRSGSRRTGSTTAGARTGRAWSTRRTSTTASRTSRRNGSSRPPRSSTPASASPAAGHVLDAVGPLPREGGRDAQEEHPRLLLAHRPRERHPLAAERRAQRPLVRDRAPRAGPRLLLHELHPARGAAAAPHRRQPRVPRGDGRADRAGRGPGAVPAVERHAAAGLQDRPDGLPAERGARRAPSRSSSGPRAR